MVTNFRQIHFTVPATRNDHGRSSYADTTGLHYFLEGDVAQLDLEIPEGIYKAMHETITLDNAARQTATVHVEGGLPVRGRFLDAAGKPAPDIALSIYKTGVPLSSGTLGMDVLDIRATTDAEGRFEFPSAPDECFAYASHVDPVTRLLDSPAIEPLKITRTERTFEQTVPAHGSVRVLLPQGFALPPRMNYLMMIPNGSTRQMQIETRIDPATGAIQSGGLAPGRYHLAADAIAGLGDISSVKRRRPRGRRSNGGSAGNRPWNRSWRPRCRK